MNCTTCSAVLDAQATACPRCGAPVPGGTPPPPPPPPPAGGWSTGGPHPSGRSSEARGWSIAAHLGGLVLGVGTAAVFGFVAPLLVWLFKRDEDPYIEVHAKEALNFQLTVLSVVVLMFVLAIPGIVVGFVTLGLAFVAFAILALVATVAWVVLPILAAVRASSGEWFRYPLTIRFVS